MASKTELEVGRIQAIDTLRWWILGGVTTTLEDKPRDRFAVSLARSEGYRDSPNASNSTNKTPRRLSETASHLIKNAHVHEMPLIAQSSSLALARESTDLQTLRSAMAEFDGCPLKRTATQLVFADGIPGSRIMFVGEAPGEGEDRIGRPFVGRAGQLLDRMLNAIGLDRHKVYIANVVPWRPPGNRTPTLAETQTCLPFIERQIDLADPEYLICLGGSAARTLLGVQEGITRARGLWRPYLRQSGQGVRALAMLHPAFLLRQPAHKRFAWADMRALARALKSLSR
jgi:uracil-DNA glycosylase family 4